MDGVVRVVRLLLHFWMALQALEAIFAVGIADLGPSAAAVIDMDDVRAALHLDRTLLHVMRLSGLTCECHLRP
jgi:hypothetical protein